MQFYRLTPAETQVAQMLAAGFGTVGTSRRLMSAMRSTVGGGLIVLLVAMTGGSEVLAGEMTPLERVTSTPKGELKNPYADFASVAEEGHRKYMAAG